MKNALIVIFLLTFPITGFALLQPPDVKVRLSIDERKISKDKDSAIKAKIYVSNISKQSVLIVVDEPIRLSYNVKKRELGLGLERDYSEFNYKIPRLKLLRPNKHLVIKRSVSTSLFAKISNGKWYLDSMIGYIVESDFEKLGLTPKILKKKKSKDKIKISFNFSPHEFAEIQHFEISDEVEIDVNSHSRISFGDKSAQDEIKKKTSAIYDNKDKTHFFLTKKSFGAKSTCGTEITAYSKDNKINRIVSKSCTKRGRLATEFYFENEKPIFVYQVFEYFKEKTKKDAWKNFKGLASWESRYYFVANKLEFHRHKGQKDISEKETGEKQKTEAFNILNFVRKKILAKSNVGVE